MGNVEREYGATRMGADVETFLRRVADLIVNAQPVPSSASVMVNPDEVLELVDEAVAHLPEELRAARWLLREREEFRAKVLQEADEILEEARVRAERMVKDLAVPLPFWWEQLSHRAQELLRLPLDWDSYGASAVGPGAVKAAFRFLARFMADDLPIPQLTPTSVGSVNVEWHLSDTREIEVEFDSDGDIEALIVDGDVESAFPKGTNADFIAQVVPALLRAS